MGGFFVELHVFLQMISMCLLVTKRAVRNFEIAKLQRHSFHVLNQVTLGNYVIDAPASKTDVILSRNTHVSSTELNSDFWTNQSLSPPRIT